MFFRATMIYPKNFEQKISFDKVRDLLSQSCLCALGRERVGQMEFLTDVRQIRSAVRQTMEFVHILQEDDFPSQNFFDVRSALKHIRIENTFLDVPELFDLQRSLSTIVLIVAFLKKNENGEEAV